MTDPEPTACQLTGLSEDELDRAVAAVRKVYGREGWLDAAHDPIPTDAEWRLAVARCLQAVLEETAEGIVSYAFGPRGRVHFPPYLEAVIEGRAKATA